MCRHSREEGNKKPASGGPLRWVRGLDQDRGARIGAGPSVKPCTTFGVRKDRLISAFVTSSSVIRAKASVTSSGAGSRVAPSWLLVSVLPATRAIARGGSGV